jgi:hypothetical protein
MGMIQPTRNTIASGRSTVPLPNYQGGTRTARRGSGSLCRRPAANESQRSNWHNSAVFHASRRAAVLEPRGIREVDVYLDSLSCIRFSWASYLDKWASPN